MRKILFIIMFLLVSNNVGATIAYRSSSVTTSAGASTVVITAPSGITDDDILVSIINSNTSATTITPPTGWTLIDSEDPASANISIYWKRASSESGNYTFTLSSSERYVGAISVFSGCISSGSPVDVYSTRTGSTEDREASSITTTVDNAMLVYFAGIDGATVGSWTPDSSMTESVDSNSTQSTTINYELLGTAGATGTREATCTDTTSGGGVMFLLGLKPASNGIPISETMQLSGVRIQ